MTSGFRIYSQKSLNLIPYNDITSDGYSFQIEMTSIFINTNLKSMEIPITFEERRLNSMQKLGTYFFNNLKQALSLKYFV